MSLSDIPHESKWMCTFTNMCTTGHAKYNFKLLAGLITSDKVESTVLRFYPLGTTFFKKGQPKYLDNSR